MKKFLIGIVSLVAMVVLTSPAFGALDYSWSDPGVGTFYFDVPLATTDPLKITNLGPPVTGAGSDAGFDAVSFAWGAMEPLQVPNGFINDSSGLVTFDPGVQIIVAQWGGPTQYGFLFDGYTQNFKWENLINDRNGSISSMSHTDGYNSVPIPAAAWLLGSGMLGLLVVRRRRSS